MACDNAERAECDPVFEKKGTRLKEDEVVLLVDLLEEMLRYLPDERITIEEVVQHPWFRYV
jgi:serine/threonine-protein kinase SRPK3